MMTKALHRDRRIRNRPAKPDAGRGAVVSDVADCQEVDSH